MIGVLAWGVISTLVLDGEVPDDGSDFHVVEFEAPADTVELQVDHAATSDRNVLDWGLWRGAEFRGWGGGLTEPAVVGLEAASRGYLPGPVEGTWRLVIGKALIREKPAGYAVTVTFRDAPELDPQVRTPHAPPTLATGARWYKGDFHVHSRESGDATATFAEIVALARERGLDFVVITDHNTVSHHDLLAAAQEGVDDVLLIRGIEVTTYAGHGNAIGVTGFVDFRVGLGGRTAAAIIGDVVDQEGLFIVNHPTLELGGACIGCAWRHEDTPWEQVAAIEIQTGPYEFGATLFTPQAIALWDELLDAGRRITAVGGSDDHRAGKDLNQFQSPIGSPTTLVWAEALSEAAILEGIRAGRAIVNLRAPDDPLLEIVAIGADGTRAPIGGTVAGHDVELEVRAVGAAGRQVAIVRNGEPVEAATVDGEEWTRTFRFRTSADGDRFRAHLDEGGLDVVVTNHVFATWLPREGGCGCAASRGGAAVPGGVFALGAVLLAALRRRRRAR